ncbi:MAG: depupylase/deamidase Dop [Acidimicrobiales bacterium]
MAIAKVCGTETEYGITWRGARDPNPITASSMLINAYLAARAGSSLPEGARFDFENESPGRDARGFGHGPKLAPEVETHLVNAVLTNGARYYVDHAHPEFSTPECATPLELVRFDKAGEVVLARSMDAVNSLLPAGESIVVYKNNSDRKGNSYGAHENYLVDRATPFSRIVAYITPHLVSRQIYAGAGKVGAEVPVHGDVPFQLTQRADFFEEEVGLETTLKRPIVNTRDEPHADSRKYRRLHVIIGDANLAEVAIFLKIGVTSIVLAMIEDDWLGALDLALASPVQALRQVSYDLTVSKPLRLASGRQTTALGIQWDLFEMASKYAETVGLGCVGAEDEGRAVLQRWESVLTALESGPMSLSSQLDWVAKYSLLSNYRERHGLSWSDHRMAAMDLQYHDVRPGRSLFAKLNMERLVEPEAVVAAVSEPPKDTRAYFRGRCLARFGSAVSAANWDSLVFDLGSDPLRRVPTLEPLRGTEAHVGQLLDSCSTPAELLERLGS